MKVAVLSDIHGNHYALNAVINSRDFIGVEHIFVLGDIVGYYYEPDIVLEKLNQYSLDLIIGNHDLFLRKDLNTQLNEIRKKYGQGIDIALKKLSSKHLNQLIQSPEQKIVKLDNVVCMLCHGSPWKIDEYIYPDSPVNKLENCANHAIENGCNFLFLGHTHYPFMFFHNGCVVSNPGSVGQARDAGGLACWQLFDTTTKVLIQKRTPYDIKQLQKNVYEHDPNLNYLSNILEGKGK